MENLTVQQRQKQKYLEKKLNDLQEILENRSPESHAIYEKGKQYLLRTFDNDYSRIVEFIVFNLRWPLAFKRELFNSVKKNFNPDELILTNFTNFVSNPGKNIKDKFNKSSRFTRIFHPGVSIVTRHFGFAVSSIIRLDCQLFFMNLLMLIVWLCSITVPYEVFSSSSSLSNASFDFGSIFTSDGYLSESMLFQGFYPNSTFVDRYDLPLIYLIMSYVYYLFWIVFLTVRFGQTYKMRILESVLHENNRGFKITFTRYNFKINRKTNRKKNQISFEKQYFDYIASVDHQNRINEKQFQTFNHKFKKFVMNLFFVLLSVALGALNWLILSRCKNPGVQCHQSIIFLVLINRFGPYFIVLLSGIEKYKNQSDRIDTVAFRSVFLHMCTILSFIIYFFTHSTDCYETSFGQFIYLLLLAESFASLLIPFVTGLLFDLMHRIGAKYLDGINVNLQLTSSSLLYGQFLAWIGFYYIPLVSILTSINLLFAFLSNHLYFFIRSKRENSMTSTIDWDQSRVEYVFYLVAYILFIFSVTCFTVFTTQLTPSESCGPFRSLDRSYDVITSYLSRYENSALGISIIDYLTSPGFIYFLAILLFVICFKLQREYAAEKKLVFIRQNNSNSKRNLRKKAVESLAEEVRLSKLTENPIKSTIESSDRDESDDDQTSHF